MSQLREGLYFGAIRVVRWMWSHPQRTVPLPMHVGGFTAQRTDEPNNASILGCLRIDLELMAAATDTSDKEVHFGHPLFAERPKSRCCGEKTQLQRPRDPQLPCISLFVAFFSTLSKYRVRNERDGSSSLDPRRG